MNNKYNKESTFQLASRGGDNYSHNCVASEAVQAMPLEVKVYNNNFDKALRAFRALVQKEKILSIYKDRQTYEKPSQKRRRRKNESKRKVLDSMIDKKNYKEE